MIAGQLAHLSMALVLTYINALCGVVGIGFAMHGNIKGAFLMIVIAALCDVFDGVVARRKKQTTQESRRGIVADSIADMVSFGVLPAVIVVSLTDMAWWAVIAAVVYVVGAIHRLVVFSGVALETQKPTRYFEGVPVIMGAMALTVLFVICHTYAWFVPVFGIGAGILGVLFVSRFPVRKPHGIAAYISYIIIATGSILGLLL